MLRTTAIKHMRAEPILSSDVRKAAEIFHGSFSPRLGWYEKSRYLYKVHQFKKRVYNKKWTLETLAKFCETDLSYIIKLYTLYQATLEHPRLKYVPNWKHAYKLYLLKSDKNYKIELYLAKRGIIPEDIDNNE